MPAHLNAHDFEILRRLGARKAAIAQEPANRERRHAWYAHDSGAGDARPMILAEVGGVMGEVFADNWLHCTDPWARDVERGLRLEIWQYEVLQDDHVVEPYITTNWQMTVSDYGVAAKMHRPVTDGTLGARACTV